jgi:hypothetical protein
VPDGGGGRAGPGPTTPAPPTTPTHGDCGDGDGAGDADGERNGEWFFDVQLCANSTILSGCEPYVVESVTIDHAIDDGRDRRFDVDFQALQVRVTSLGLPSASEDDCTAQSAITVRLRGPDSSSRMKKSVKTLKVTTFGSTAAGPVRDIDKVKFACRPEGDGIYLATDLYDGTFDRIGRQMFATSCATSGCHDSESVAGGLNLLPDSAYANLVGVPPSNVAANTAGLLRVTPGDPSLSFLHRKITGDLQPGFGSSMPLSGPDVPAHLVEIIRLWIIGDGMLGGAPQHGWVAGTDQ